MFISEQTKIAIKLLAEDEISLVDERGDITIAVERNGTHYVFDPDATDPLQAWLDVDSGQVAPNVVQQELLRIVDKDPEYNQYLKDMIRQIAIRKRRKARGPVGPDADEWLRTYVARFEDLEDRGGLNPVPEELSVVFKNASARYMMYDDPRKDFIAIMPTPRGLSNNPKDRAVYVLRKYSHADIPKLGIHKDEPYTTYVGKVVSAIENNNLLAVREVLVETGLGVFFRRDKRILTVTEWIPSTEYQSFDKLANDASNIIEQIERIASIIPECLTRVL